MADPASDISHDETETSGLSQLVKSCSMRLTSGIASYLCEMHRDGPCDGTCCATQQRIVLDRIYASAMSALTLKVQHVIEPQKSDDCRGDGGQQRQYGRSSPVNVKMHEDDGTSAHEWESQTYESEEGERVLQSDQYTTMLTTRISGQGGMSLSPETGSDQNLHYAFPPVSCDIMHPVSGETVRHLAMRNSGAEDNMIVKGVMKQLGWTIPINGKRNKVSTGYAYAIDRVLDYVRLDVYMCELKGTISLEFYVVENGHIPGGFRMLLSVATCLAHRLFVDSLYS